MKKHLFLTVLLPLIIILSGISVTGIFAEEQTDTGYYYGDVNLSTSVDAADALIVLKHAAKLETIDAGLPLTLADIMHDNTIDSSDALEILKVAAKLSDSVLYVSTATPTISPTDTPEPEVTATPEPAPTPEPDILICKECGSKMNFQYTECRLETGTFIHSFWCDTCWKETLMTTNDNLDICLDCDAHTGKVVWDSTKDTEDIKYYHYHYSCNKCD